MKFEWKTTGYVSLAKGCFKSFFRRQKGLEKFRITINQSVTEIVPD